MSLDRDAAAEVLFATAQAARQQAERFAVFDGWADDQLADALETQLAVLDRWRQAGEQLGGWKVGMTSGAARDAMGPGFRPFGYLLASRIFRSGANIDLGLITGAPKLEAEIGLTLGERLGGPEVSRDQARAAVASVAPCFELVESRLPPKRRRPPVRIADQLGNWGIVVGPDHSTDVDLSSLRVQLCRDGEPTGSGTTGPDVLDDPYLSLARLCQELSRRQISLEPGQRVITGSLVEVAMIQSPGRWAATFGELGDVEVNFV